MGSTKKTPRKISRKEREAQKALKAKQLRKKLLLIGGVLLLLVAVSLGVFFPMRAAGVFLRGKTVASTEHYKVDGAMYSYYFYSSFYDELAGSGATVYANNGVTESADLKSLNYGENKSWFSFFESVSATRLQNILQYAEAAADEGVTLSAAGEEELEKTVARLRSTAAGKGISFDRYLAERFGIGVKEKDIRSFLEIYLLAGEMAEKVKEDVPVSVEELNALREDPAYMTASFFYYVCKAELRDSMSEQKQEELKTEARENARRLTEITDPQAFINEVRRQETQLAEGRGEALTDEYFAEVQADFSYFHIPYDTAIHIDEEIGSRKARETVLFAQEETGSYGVVLIIEPLHIDETPSYNYHTVTFSEGTVAESLLVSLAGTAGASSDGREVLAGHTASTEEEFLTAATSAGGRDRGLTKNGAAKDAEDENLAAWLGDGRKAGDLLLLTEGKKLTEGEDITAGEDLAAGEGDSDGKTLLSGSATMVYYCGDGYTAFEKAARNRILSQKYAEIDKEIAEKYASVTVKENSGKAVADRR